MDLRSLRVIFDDGGLHTAEASRVDGTRKAKWRLMFTRRNGERIAIGTTRAPDETKEFSSLDAVAVAAEEIGFTKFEVILKKNGEQ